jgi:hypothetical protein
MAMHGHTHRAGTARPPGQEAPLPPHPTSPPPPVLQSGPSMSSCACSIGYLKLYQLEPTHPAVPPGLICVLACNGNEVSSQSPVPVCFQHPQGHHIQHWIMVQYTTQQTHVLAVLQGGSGPCMQLNARIQLDAAGCKWVEVDERVDVRHGPWGSPRADCGTTPHPQLCVHCRP